MMKRTIKITSRMLSDLRREKKRTDLGAKAIAKNLKSSGFNISWQTINNWLHKTPKGEFCTCDPIHYEIVMNYLSTQPDAFYLSEQNRHTKLLKEMRRTGLGAIAICKSLKEKHPTLTANIINTWLLKKPNGDWLISTCNPIYYEAVMHYLLNQPDTYYLADKNNRRGKLKQEMQRTGLGAVSIRRGLGGQRPNLTVNTINNWIFQKPNGKWMVLKCNPEDYEAVMAYLRQQPNQK